MKKLLSVAIICGLISCKQPYKESWLVRVEKAHGKEAFQQKKVLAAHLELRFGGKMRFSGKVQFSTDSRSGVLRSDSGSVIEYQDGLVRYSPDVSAKQALFDAYTWSYFSLLPYKLSDDGTRLSEISVEPLPNRESETRYLQFKDSIGVSAQDWYVLYTDPKSNLLQAAGYIVTANASVEEAEADPHAIVYGEYREPNGIPIATSWKFYSYSKEAGLGELLGEARLWDLHFSDQVEFSGREDLLELRAF